MKTERVNHPDHYQGKVECIDGIEAAVEHHPGPIAFSLGNALKYVWRAGRKGELREDLLKAKWYIDRALSLIDDQQGAR